MGAARFTFGHGGDWKVGVLGGLIYGREGCRCKQGDGTRGHSEMETETDKEMEKEMEMEWCYGSGEGDEARRQCVVQRR